MALFNPNLIFKKKKPVEENYLALTLTPEKVLALIWAFEQTSVRVLGYAEANIKDRENLVHQVAVAIDQASEEAKSDVSQVVFGLARNWFDDGQISPETSKLLEDMAGDLELKAQAFVPLSVAIKNYLKAQEGAALHAICIGLFENLCEAHLIKSNQVAASTQAKTKPTPEKIMELIKSLDAKESLPSRIVVFGEHDARIAGKLQDSNLSTLFTQEPRIEYLSEKELATSTAFAQGADILGHEVTMQAGTQPLSKPEGAKEPDEFGFVEGEDILRQETSENVVGQQEAPLQDLQEQNFPYLPPQHTKENLSEVTQEHIKSPRAGILDQILTLAWFEKLTGIFKKPDSSSKITVAAVALVALFLLSSLILGQTIVRSQVTIRVKSQPQEENFNAQVTVGSDSNFDKKQIAGETITASANDSQKGVPTGKKKLGNNAKGQVTVFNITASPKTFSRSATLITKDGLKFTLDEQIEATSASKPGQASETKANVTATEVGPQYNLNQGEQFSFTQFDEFSYWAQNDTPFTGGDEKEITVVSAGDMDKLEKSLTAELKDKAIENLKSSSSNKVINDDVITIDVAKKQFDKKVDEEATLFNLDMEITASVITYEQSTLNELLANVANQDAPQDLEAKGENIEILSVNSKASGGKLNLAGRFRANFIPKFDENDLKNKIAGKGEKQTREILLQIPQISDVSVSFSPGFLLAPKIPKKADRVTLKIETAT